VTAQHVVDMQTFAPMETLISMYLFNDFELDGGAILLDGG